MTNSQKPQTVTINSALVGSIAVALLGIAAVLWYFAGSENMFTGACLKVGLVMAALWLALPTIARHGSWGQTSWGVVVGFIALALVLTGKKVDTRLVLAILLGVVATIMVLRPRSNSRPK